MRQQIAATVLLVTGWLTPLPAVAQDDMPQVTLAEALQRATRLDPNYVAAMRQAVDAEWGRRSAW
ncbi:MAG: hypothetical protein AMS18_06690 [Gemmatimonas sp. SG8_17]|nr:MAG: hypothetical protein AMS18_06690 [Gemmatimonas sp. SG8_17]